VAAAAHMQRGAAAAAAAARARAGRAINARMTRLISTVGVAKVNFFNVVQHTIRIHVLLTASVGPCLGDHRC
jgi:hypothetical protein